MHTEIKEPAAAGAGGKIPLTAPKRIDSSATLASLRKHNLELRLFPVFDLRRRQALTLFCVPTRLVTGGELKLGHWLLEGLSEDAIATIDVEMLRAAVGYAKRLGQSNAIVGVGVAVSFSTLINPEHRRAYIDVLRAVSLPPTNPLVMQIERIPPGTPMLRMANAVNQVGPIVRRVLMTIPTSGDVLWSLGALGATGIGVNLTGRENSALVSKLARSLMVLCRSQGALGYMNMLMTPESVAAAAEAGVRFGTGPALSLTLHTIDGPLPKVPILARDPK